MDESALSRFVEQFNQHLPRTLPVWKAVHDLPASPDPIAELAAVQAKITAALMLLEFQMAVDRGDLSQDELSALLNDEEAEIRFTDTPDDLRDLD